MTVRDYGKESYSSVSLPITALHTSCVVTGMRMNKLCFKLFFLKHEMLETVFGNEAVCYRHDLQWFNRLTCLKCILGTPNSVTKMKPQSLFL